MKARSSRDFPERGPSGAKAFTLIEIMVVVALIGIVLTMGLPAIRGAMKRDPMTQAVVDVTDACKAARAQAILTGNPSILKFYPAQRRIEVPGSVAPAPAHGGETANPKTGQTAAKGFSAEISDRIKIEMVDVNFVDCLRLDAATVNFQPNGTCDEFNLILHAETGEARRIALDIVTSLPNVTTIQ